MSASALKTTMQGVGSSPPTSGHSILPMNVVAQKVVPGTESSASMKPLSTSGMSYTMLQPPTSQQPMSLVQDHRSQVYQNQNQSFSNNSTTTTTTTTTMTPTVAATTTTTTIAAAVTATTTAVAAVSSTQAVTTAGVTTTTTTTTSSSTTTTPPPTTTNVAVDKDAGDKLITNGVESTTPPTNDPELIEQNKVNNQDTNINNNSSPDNNAVDTQDSQKKTEARPIVADTSAAIQVTKVEEKTPVNNGAKETETSTTLVVVDKKADEKIVTTPVKVDNDNSQAVATKIEQKSPTTPRSTQKRKSREIKDIKSGNDGGKPKRNRVQTQPYQSPLPEIALIVKETMKKSVTPNKNPDDKLIVFYKNEFLAVRNSEGSFYVCQAMQNIYKSSRRIRIRWLSQDKNNGEIYSPDFYDFTDFDCILTNLNLNKIDKNKYQLTKIELLRTENILKRAIDVEAGVSEKPSVTEEHPDGLDLSLFKDESQLKRRKGGSNKTPKRQRKRSKQDETSSSSDEDEDEEDDDDDSSSSDEDEDKKTNSKTSRSKRTTNKALALAKSLVKVPNRANRALLRGTRTNPAESTPSTADKKTEVKKTQPTTSTASTSPRTKLRGPAQSNEQESSNNSTTGRAKRSTTAAAAAAAAATTTTTTGVSSTDNSSTRKKSQGST